MGARRRRAIVRGAFYEFWHDAFSLLPLRGAAGPDVGELVGARHLEPALGSATTSVA